MHSPKTLVIMVSVGDRSHLSDISFSRAQRWATRNNYSIILIKIPMQPSNRSPHYGKLAAPRLFPGFDRYIIIDDDLLMSRNAPPAPNVETGKIGIARDEVQVDIVLSYAPWNANTGFMIIDKDAIQYLEDAIVHGDESLLPGPYDQGALNIVGWRANVFQEIDQRWNFQLINHFITKYKSWNYWDKHVSNRILYFFNIMFNPFSIQRKLIKNCYGCHLIKCKYIRLIDSILH